MNSQRFNQLDLQLFLLSQALARWRRVDALLWRRFGGRTRRLMAEIHSSTASCPVGSGPVPSRDGPIQSAEDMIHWPLRGSQTLLPVCPMRIEEYYKQLRPSRSSGQSVVRPGFCPAVQRVAGPMRALVPMVQYDARSHILTRRRRT